MDNNPRAIAKRLADLDKEFQKLLRDAPWKQRGQPDSPQHAPTKERNRTPRQPLPTPEVKPSPANSDQTEEAWHQSLQRWKLGLEMVAIPFAIAYAVITYAQWRDLRKNFEIDQRAWLTRKVNRPYINDKPTDVAVVAGQPLVTHVVITNIGKTPAANIDGDFALAVLANGQAPEFSYSQRTHFGDKLIVPADSATISVRLHDLKGIHTVTPEEVYATVAGSMHVVEYGRMTYRDIFGNTHWYRFCEFLDIGDSRADPKAQESCSNYNGSGDN